MPLQSRQIVDQYIILDSDTLLAELSGIFFGVAPDIGMQLLLGPEIKEAFTQGNSLKMIDLEKKHGEAFWIAFRSTRKLWQITENNTDESILNFIKCLSDSFSTKKNKIHHDINIAKNIVNNKISKSDIILNDYSDHLKYLSKLLDASDKILDIITDYTKNSLSKMISQVGNESFPKEKIISLEALISLCNSSKSPLKRTRYQHLNANRWTSWTGYLEEYNLHIDNVLPGDNAITELAGMILSDSIQLDQNLLKSLTKAYDIYPNSNEWDGVINNLKNWLTLNHRPSHCDSIYDFIYRILISKNTFDILECFSKQKLWELESNYVVKNSFSLSIFAAIKYEDDLQTITFIPSGIKEFWGSEKDMETLQTIYSMFELMGKLESIWKLSTDENNLLAIQIIRSFDNSELYGNWAAGAHIDSYKWCKSDEIDTLIQKFIEHDSFLNNFKNMENEQRLYADVFRLFKNRGAPKIDNFINSQIQKIDTDEWIKLITESHILIELLDEKNQPFTEALYALLKDIIDSKVSNETSTAIINNLIQLLDKATDVNTILIPQVRKYYFSQEEDNIEPDLFEQFISIVGKTVKDIDEKLLVERLYLWIKSKQKSRIEWLLNGDKTIRASDWEGIEGFVKFGITSNDKDEIEIANLIANKLNINIEDDLDLTNDEIPSNNKENASIPS